MARERIKHHGFNLPMNEQQISNLWKKGKKYFSAAKQDKCSKVNVFKQNTLQNPDGAFLLPVCYSRGGVVMTTNQRQSWGSPRDLSHLTANNNLDSITFSKAHSLA